MLLNIKLVEMTENSSRYLPIGIITGFIFLYQILYSFEEITTINTLSTVNPVNYLEFMSSTNIQLIAEILYTDYALYFLISGLVLLVSMIGAIVLCLHHESNVKRQDLFAQVSTDYNKTISLR
jgi:NADH-quinone oxidoreductase subunit J